MAKITFNPQSPVISVDITIYGERDIKRRIMAALEYWCNLYNDTMGDSRGFGL